MASAAADIKLLAGTANPLLADEVSEAMGIPLCEVDIKTFADGERALHCVRSARVLAERARCARAGEVFVQIGENVRGCDVFVIQPTCSVRACHTSPLALTPPFTWLLALTPNPRSRLTTT